MTKRVLLCLAIFSFLVISATASAQNMKEGKWEITTKVEMPGMPANIPAQKSVQCMTKKDSVPSQPEKNKDCKITSMKTSGDTIYWTMQCKSGQGTTNMKGQITYKGDKMEGVMNTTIIEPDGDKMQMTSRINGRRIGDCK